ncbi:phthiocerol/phthiodiolone dimycocerosyl transferase family protein [Streptomyces pseudogriseolus]|uniref:phthiocerol/phthiodiolone dimycocerosyl transferase family protein n=1 Tax=Streptomyces pseudogriseolus TaxID=36817 RepID=UPI00068BA2FE|nr:protein kinase [Streptomyces gancidicus]
MRRVLCPVETLYVGQRSRAVLSCALRGPVDAAALSRALDTVTAEQPTLRTRIVQDGAGYALELLGEAERPRLTVRTGGDEVYQEELNTPLPVGTPLTRAVLASEPDGDRHLLVVSVDHTVTDGHSAITLLNTLWDRYRALVEDGDAAAGAAVAAVTEAPATASEQPVWPTPVSELLPPVDEAETAAYLRRRLAETEGRSVELLPYDTPRETHAAAGNGDPAGTADEPRIEACRLLLDADRTERLRKSARAAGVSVHGLIGSALLTVVRRRLGGDGPRVLGCLSPVDLRSRLHPPVPASTMVAAVTTHLHAVEVDADSDPLALARELGTHLRDAIERGDHFQDMRIMTEVPKHPALQMGTVIVTNMGSVPGPRLPEGTELTDVRLVPAREQYFPQAGRSPLMACVVSFDGRLAIEFPHYTACFSPAFMRDLRDDVRTALLAFTETGDEPPVTAAAV